MSSIGGTNSGMPNTSQPFVGVGNIITRPWFLLLQTVFNRTGGAAGGTAVPPAAVLDFAGAAADVPIGFLECGQAVSRVQYKVLFDIIGITYGPGNGITTFDLPPLAGPYIKMIKW